MIEIIRNPKSAPVTGFIVCPSTPPMKCACVACISMGFKCHLYKGIKTEFWK